MMEIMSGERTPPEGMVVTATDEEERAKQIGEQAAAMGVEAFVRACEAQDGVVADEEDSEESVPDPDKGKHAFEVFLDCLALDDNLIVYLIEVLKNRDWAEFNKLSRITTNMDLDPEEFLYWLAHREDYAEAEEQMCAQIMDRCLERLMVEGQTETVAALISGDETTFNAFRCEAPELVHLPDATFEWYARNYLDRDYPIRALMRWNGVDFETKRG
jgi:predicted RNase H-like HicB family nuclease